MTVNFANQNRIDFASKHVVDKYFHQNLLILVLTCVLIWYTFACPPIESSPHNSKSPKTNDLEEKNLDEDNEPPSLPLSGVLINKARLVAANERASAENLEWPEILDC